MYKMIQSGLMRHHKGTEYDLVFSNKVCFSRYNIWTHRPRTIPNNRRKSRCAETTHQNLPNIPQDESPFPSVSQRGETAKAGRHHTQQ